MPNYKEVEELNRDIDVFKILCTKNTILPSEHISFFTRDRSMADVREITSVELTLISKSLSANKEALLQHIKNGRVSVDEIRSCANIHGRKL